MEQTPPAEERPSVELRKRVAAHDGAQLLRNPCDNPVCKLSHNKDIDCIEVVWRKYATSAQLHYVHEVILCMLVRDNVSKILGDDSCLPIIHAEDQRWIIEQWLPRAKAAGLAAAASVISTIFLLGQRSRQFNRCWPAKFKFATFTMCTLRAVGSRICGCRDAAMITPIPSRAINERVKASDVRA